MPRYFKGKLIKHLTKPQRIEYYAFRIKEIFQKDRINQDDINTANKFIEQWKNLTQWTEQ